jgi:hypothetical protein
LRVLEDGREARKSGDYREYQGERTERLSVMGSDVKVKSKVTRRRKVKRNVGAMAGKGVWSRADVNRVMARELAQLQAAAFRKAMGR